MTRELLNQLFELHQMPVSDHEPAPKLITGYCEPWSLRAGETIEWFGSSLQATTGDLDVVKLNCGDPTRSGPGFSEDECEIVPTISIDLINQPIVPGSYAEALVLTGKPESFLTLSLWFQPTLLKRDAVIISLESEGSDIEVYNAGTSLLGRFGGVEHPLRKTPLERRRWYLLTIDIDGEGGVATVSVSSPGSASPARDLLQQGEEASTLDVPELTFKDPVLRLAAGLNGERWDGRVADPKLRVGPVVNEWRLEVAMEEAIVPAAIGESNLHLLQLPTRGVTGPQWTGDHQRWSDGPNEWNAIHFHHDDLYDAGWQPNHRIDLPPELPSGIYCFRFRSELGVDRIPFFVRPAVNAHHSEVALLVPSATYMAYANHRMLIEGADFVGARTNLRPEHQYLVDHGDLGLSHYEKHPDGSGVMFSSRRRPVLQVRPGADGWNFTPDTDINAFLLHAEVGHDIVADEDLHTDGYAALAPYRVIVTGSHPEYWSTAMLDALDEWQRQGGRLMYLGGNGFYWRVAFSEHWPGAIELRRAEDGGRNWQTGDGENYHAWGAEYGGLWRRNGRAPNELVGIGFAAQGFEKATFYQRSPEAKASRAAWILEGVDDEQIGTSGLGGGAAGQEVDRYDQRLGSPGHAVILASATEFGSDMLRTKEEFEGTVAFPIPDPFVRADMVFYETPGGGAVFSVGSISWFGALARNGYENDVARITGNVLERFLDPTPFPIPRAQAN